MPGLKNVYDWAQEYIDQYKLNYMSPSKLSMYLKCRRQFFFRYILGKIISPPGIVLVGSSSHKTFEFYYQNKIEKQEDYPLSTVTDFFIENMQESFHADWRQDEKTTVLENIGLKVVTLFREKRAVMTIPIEVEKNISGMNFSYLDTTITIAGKIDLITDTDIVDHKITARIRKPDDILNDIQLATYNLFEQIPNKKIGWDYYKRSTGKQPVNIKFDAVRIPCRSQDTTRILDLYYNAQKDIRAKIFSPCDPSNWWCSKRWCGYWEMCQGFFKEGQ